MTYYGPCAFVGFRLPTKFSPKMYANFDLIFNQKLIIHGDSLRFRRPEVTEFGNLKSPDKQTGFISSGESVDEI